MSSMLPPDPPSDPAGRFDAVVANFSAMILDTEAQQRTMLRLSLEPDRGRTRRAATASGAGRSPGSPRPSTASAPICPTRSFDQLVLAIRATVGIEAIVWLVDIAGL